MVHIGARIDLTRRRSDDVERDDTENIDELLDETTTVDRHVALVRDVELHPERAEDHVRGEVELARTQRARAAVGDCASPALDRTFDGT